MTRKPRIARMARKSRITRKPRITRTIRKPRITREPSPTILPAMHLA